jgi:hypothetical protein
MKNLDVDAWVELEYLNIHCLKFIHIQSEYFLPNSLQNLFKNFISSCPLLNFEQKTCSLMEPSIVKCFTFSNEVHSSWSKFGYIFNYFFIKIPTDANKQEDYCRFPSNNRMKREFSHQNKTHLSFGFCVLSRFFLLYDGCFF